MRAQAHALEGTIAALLLLSSLVFALQATGVTPLSASTSSQHIENQERALADGVLSLAAENGSLRRAVLYWDDTASPGGFHATGGDYYRGDHGLPPTGTSTVDLEFADSLSEAFSRRAIAYNVYFVHQTDSGTERLRFVYRGEPSDNAVSVSRTVTLYDDSRLTAADGTATTTTLSGASSFYAEDVSSGSDVYNVVRVEVVVWRM
jgi:hypothetical protein